MKTQMELATIAKEIHQDIDRCELNEAIERLIVVQGDAQEHYRKIIANMKDAETVFAERLLKAQSYMESMRLILDTTVHVKPRGKCSVWCPACRWKAAKDKIPTNP